MTATTIGSLCSGYGGLDMAVEGFFGARTAWFAEYDAAPSKVLAHHWPDVPNLGDMTGIDWSTVPKVDIVTGGTPCQDLSGAGKRRGMTEGTRSNLWVQMRECIATVRPSVVVWENVRGAYSAHATSEVESEPGLLGEPYGPARPALRALHRVLGDLAELGFDAEVVPVRASDAGAPHQRFRVFVVAHANDGRRGECDQRFGRVPVADAGGYVGPAETLTLLPTTTTTQDASNTGGPSQYDRNTRPLNTEVTLLPTPAAMNPNDGEGFETWEARRQKLIDKGINGNGMGMPLAIATQLLPTPQAHDALGGKTPEQVATMRARTGAGVANLNEVAPLLPTPTTAIATGGNAVRGGARCDEKLLPGIVQDDLAKPGTTTSVTEYEALWESLDDQSPFWRTVDGKDYWPAIERWTAVIGRPAPSPTLPDGKDGRHRLNARLAEWMMGLPEGHVTAPEIGLSRNEQLKALGNGVVTQQARLALSIAWRRLADVREAVAA